VTSGGRSAIVLTVQLPASVRRVRARFDPMAARGVPPHVTLIFPFVPVARLGAGQKRRLAAIAGAATPFEMRLSDVRRFPSSLYLAPIPTAPIQALIGAIIEAFPEHLPYEGHFAEVIPHLTVAHSIDEATMSSLEPALRAALPIVSIVRVLTVLEEDPAGRWRTRWRIPFGVGAR
jgi:2'-5' RNA ligase